MAWNIGRLGDVCRVVPGYAFKSRDWQTTGIPVVKIKNITGDNSVDLATTDCVTESLLTPKLQKFVINDGDILVAMTGATAGKVGRVRTNRLVLLNQRVAKIAPADADPNFIWAVVSSEEYQKKFFYLADGAAQPNMSGGQIEEVEIPLPPLPIQRRIAGILSAYDELIENSQRRIKILESMARGLYREWFVHFRFPGHESVPRVPSPLGEIPQGWEVRKLADFVTTKYGYTESTNVEPVGPKYLRGMDINKTSFIDWSQVPYCPISQEDHEAYRLKVGDVLVIRMADPGKVGIVEQEVDAVFASYLIRIAPKYERLSPYFLFYLMESAEYYAYITGASTGTTRKSASAGVIADYPFAVPPQNLISQFEERASEFRSLLTTLLKQVVNLRRTRDLLLPRLLSGQIDVEALDHV
jgi:type I restriction enzyme S subunit